MTVQLQADTIETIESTVTSPDVDPTTEPVWWSFTQGADPPTVWTLGAWELTLPAPVLTADGWDAVAISPTIGGPGATVELAVGTWDAWVKIGDGVPPEVPVKSAGQIVVSAAGVMFAGSTCDPWATSTDLCCDTTAYTEEQIDRAIAVSGAQMYRASGRQYPGVCTDIIRPGDAGCGVQWLAYAFSGGARPITGCTCSASCLAPHNAIALPGAPVVAVDQVRINGVVLDPAEYVLRDARYLLRVNGSWPCSQRIDLAATEDGTMEVVYRFGSAPPVDGVVAAADLACSVLADCADGSGGDSCLPADLVALVREGVTFGPESLDVGDPTSWGIPSVSRFLASVNPHGLDEPPMFVDPRRLRPVHR